MPLLLALLGNVNTANAAPESRGNIAQKVGVSPWGPKDEIGRLNLMTSASRAAIMARVSGEQAYDLAVEYFIGASLKLRGADAAPIRPVALPIK